MLTLCFKQNNILLYCTISLNSLAAQQQSYKANQVDTLYPKGQNNSQWDLSCTAQKLSLHHYLINNMNVIVKAIVA